MRARRAALATGIAARVAAISIALVLMALMAGCGTPSADLFVVNRGGSLPAARLKLRIDDGGEAHCNEDGPREVSSQQLLDARELVRLLEPDAKRGLSLAPGPGSQLHYKVDLEAGSVLFYDTSRPLRPELAKLALFTRQIAKGVCRRSR